MALISFAVAAKLICVFVFAYAKCLFSHDAAKILVLDPFRNIVIPQSLRVEFLDALHSAYQGVTSMIVRAESSVFWPGITPAITSVRANCIYIVTVVLPPTPMYRQSHRLPQITSPSVSALTTSFTKETIT